MNPMRIARFGVLFISLLTALTGVAQPWTYDFGTGTGTYSTASGASTTFLTSTPSGGGTYRVRMGSGAGSFVLANPGTSLGSATELQIIASTSASTNKFGVYDWSSPSTVAYLKAKVRNTSSGAGTLAIDLGTNANVTDNNGYSNHYNTSVATLILSYSSGTLSVSRRISGSTTAISSSGIAKDTDQLIEIYANNGASSTTYYKGGATYTLNAQTWDLWVDGTKISPAGGWAKSGSLSAGTNLSGFGFYAESSASNAARLYVDDVEYSNALPCAPPSTQASAFTFSSVTTSGMSVNWTNGNGAGRVVYMNTSNSFTAPTDGSNPTANTTYSSGQQCIFNGTGSGPVSITGLSAGTTYYFRAYEYCSSDRNYQTATATDNPLSQATPSGSAIDGTIGSGEYGTHTDGNNQNTNSGNVTYMNWDATNLYIGVSGANLGEGFVLYLDKDPQVPVNGGSNTNGTNVGFNYDGASFAALQFRADLVMYVKNSYREYRTADGSNGWSGSTSGFGSYADNGSNVREFSIPWSAIGGMPSSFNFFSYITSSTGFVYNQQPTENASGFIGTSARYERYFTVTTTTIGSATPPFSRNSYVFNATSSNNSFGAISVWDFTMNSNSLQIARSGTGAWNIGGTLVVNDGSVYFGSGGTYGATTIANVNVLGGLLSMDQTNQTMNITGNFTQSGGTFNLSTNAGGDVDLDGNWTRNGGTFNANSRAVTFSGTAAQTIGGSATTTFGYLTLNNTNGVTLNAPANVANQLTFTAGSLTTTSTNILNITNTATSAISGASTTAFVKGPMTWALPASLGSGSTYTFPVGKGTTYLPFTLNNPTTGGTGPVITVEAFTAATGGTVNSTLSSISSTEYWTASFTGNYTDGSVSLTRQTALGSLNAVARASSVSGVYGALYGTVAGTSINNSNATGASLGAFAMGVFVPLPTITSLGSSAGCQGDQIVINGTNLTGAIAANVQIGGTPVTSIVSNTGTVLTAVIGAGTTGNVTVTISGNTATSASSFTVNALPSAPGNPTSDSPQCSTPGVTLTRTGTPTGGDTWYWQTTSNGTSTANSGSTYNVTTSGTYYIRAQSSAGCWSSTSGSLAVTVNTVPAAATTPSPANNAVGVCYAGGGAISSVGWTAVSGATSYDVYFGVGSLPGTVTANVTTNSYSTGTLSASTTYVWQVVAKNACGDAVGSSTWQFTTAASNCTFTYCTPTYSSGGTNDYITQVTFGTLSQSTASNTSPYYINYTSTQNAVPSIQQAQTYSLSLTFGSDANQYSGVWVDFDQNGTFDTDEFFAGSNAGSNGTITVPIVVPVDATLGTTVMRIRGGDDSAPSSNQACGATNSSFGQTQDYSVLIAAAGPTIIPSVTSLFLPNAQSGFVSSELSYTVDGIVLSPSSGNITLTAPTGFEISLSSGSGFGSSINIAYTGGSFDDVPVYVRFAPTAADTYYTGNISHSGGSASTVNVVLYANSMSTASVVFDTFNRTDNNTVGVPSSGGSTAWTETQGGGETFRARIESNMLKLAGCSGTSGSTAGTNFEAVQFDMSNLYPTQYSSSNTTLTWSFNMQLNNSNPSGFVSSNYGLAFIIGSTQADFSSTSAKGYAVVCGQSGTPDPFSLVSFTAGIQGTLNTITSYTPAATSDVDDYYSIRVSLNTCTNEWTLEVRSDGTSAFADPAAGTYTNVTTATNSTNTSENLAYLGALWKHSSSCSYFANFDNISIPTGILSATAADITGNTAPCPSQTGLTYSVTIPGATSYSWSVPTGWSITAGASTNTITVTSGTAGQNGNITVSASSSCGSLGSATLAVTVPTPPVASVSAVASPSGSICPGTNVTFTATPTNGGSSPSYQWYLNSNPVGPNSATYSNSALVDNDVVYVAMTSNLACATPVPANSSSITMDVYALPTGAISGTTSICAGESTDLTLTVTGSGTISGTLSSGDTFSGTAPTITVSVSPSGTTVYTIATLSDANCSAISGGLTGSATVTVNPLVTPAVSIAASPSNTICAGDNVTFTATPTNGGTTPSYQWYIGASSVGTDSNTYSSSSLANGDVVSVVMTSNATCPSPSTATSNTVTMTVNALTTVSVSIAADVASPICAGTSVTFTATPTGGGSTPSYQWYIGASPVGTDSPTFTTTSLANGNVVSVQMTSNAVCPSPATATSNTLTYTVTAAPTWYQDADNDGYTSGTTLTQCAQPTGYKLITNLVGGVATPTDCNDNNEDVNPGADEWCNGVDDNCVSGIDEGLGTIAYYIDADGDGYGFGTAVVACAQPVGYVLNNNDCNDALAGVNPAATEICDGINNDCDAFIDEGCGPINDAKGTALPLTLSNYSVSSCSIFTGTLAGAQTSPEALSTAVTGEDVWYYFTAPSGGVSVQCSSTLNNIMLELQTEAGALVDVENTQSIVGNETLNYGQLVPGDAYYLCVRNYNSAQGAGGTFTLCLKSLSNTECFADPYTLSLCEQFKVSFTGGAQFIYHFGSGITHSGVYSAPPALPATTRIVLNTVPGLTHNMTFPAVWVDAVYALTDGAGNLELITVPAADSCQLTISPHADLDLRALDQNIIPSAPVTKPINSFIAAEPFICGISSYDWSFRKVDLTGAPTALDSVVVNSGSSSRFIRLNGATIPGIQPGDRFRVKIRPRFNYAGNPTPVAGDWGTDFQYVRATPPAGMTIDHVDLEYDLMLFEKEIAGEIFADIYPNPNTGEAFLLNLINLNKGTTTVNVFDSTGKLVHSEQFATEDGLFATTITPQTPLTPGIHLIEITLNNGEVMTKKLVVQ